MIWWLNSRFFLARPHVEASLWVGLVIIHCNTIIAIEGKTNERDGGEGGAGGVIMLCIPFNFCSLLFFSPLITSAPHLTAVYERLLLSAVRWR